MVWTTVGLDDGWSRCGVLVMTTVGRNGTGWSGWGVAWNVEEEDVNRKDGILLLSVQARSFQCLRQRVDVTVARARGTQETVPA